MIDMNLGRAFPVSPILSVRVRSPRLAAPRQWEFCAFSPPEPGPGELRIQMEGCGVCASGLPCWQGREWFNYPLQPGQLGHEGWGTVEAVGPGVSPDRIGERLALWCDGAFSPVLCVAEDQAVTIPPALDGKPVPVEPLGCAMNILRRSRIEPGMAVAVVGVGFIGALLIQLLKAADCDVCAVAHRPCAQRLARHLGARVVTSWNHPDRVSEVFAQAGQREFPRVIEAAGIASSLEIASSLVGTGGTLIIAGYHQDGPRSINLQDWNWKGIDVINAHERDPAVIRRGMEAAVAAMERGDIDLDPLLTHCYRPDQLAKAYKDLEERPDGFLKGWITFESSTTGIQ